MKKINLKRSFAILFALLSVVFCMFFASSCSFLNPYSDQVDSAFEITSLSITINVDENRKTEVEERVSVNFLRSRRGIIRDLPTNSGEVYENITVENITVEDDGYFLTADRNFISINTGPKGETGYKTGHYSYIFKYTIIPPSNTFNTDNFYMNIVGQGYPTTVSNVSVEVNFPFDITNQEIYCGKWGQSIPVSQSEFDSVTVDGSRLTLTATQLPPFYGATLNAKLTQNLGGYTNLKTIFAIIAAIVLLGALIAAKLLIKNKKPIEVVNFYPPILDGKTLNPAQMGMLIDNSVDSTDITALIFYWASKGYLLIENTPKGKGKNKTANASTDPFTDSTLAPPDQPTAEPQKDKMGELTLVKLKDIEGEGYEVKLFNKIFASGNNVKLSSLANKLYSQIASAQASVKSGYHGKLFDKKRLYLSVGFGLLAFAASFLGFILLGFSLNSSFLFTRSAVALAPAVGAYIIGRFALYKKHKITKSKRILLYIGQVAAAAVLSGAAIWFMGGAVALYARIALVSLSALGGIISPYFSDYTDYYNDILGQIIGFKNFLQEAEKSRLEMLLEQNPQYYYDILPYANVLGVSDIWQDKFKSLTIAPPVYYNSRVSVFDIIIFNAIYRNMFTTINTVSVSRPASSSSSGGSGGGGFRGGGFSGGGFGGGGMRSR